MKSLWLRFQIDSSSDTCSIATLWATKRWSLNGDGSSKSITQAILGWSLKRSSFQIGGLFIHVSLYSGITKGL